jgi:Transposase DDE domain group 1
VKQAVTTARSAGATGQILVRGDSAFGSGAVVSACRKAGANFSLTLQSNPKLQAAIDTIGDDEWTPVRYPGAVFDEQTGRWISNAEVAETTYTAFETTTHKVTARLIVRRVRELNPAPPGQEELFPIWRYHAFLTDTDLPTVAADLTHRRHAIIEQLFADLIDGPLAHMPSGRFPANAAWLTLAAMTHNLIRAAACLTDQRYAKARTATIRRDLINIPARLAHRARRILLHLPARWPWQQHWQTLFTNVHPPPHPA